MTTKTRPMPPGAVPPQPFTVDLQTGPIDTIDDALLDRLAGELARLGRIHGAVLSANTLARTLSVRASVDVSGAAEAAYMAAADVRVAFERAGLDRYTDLVEITAMRDLEPDEFASARDDIVGTPDVAARLGISRQRVAQLVEQKGRFPTPLTTVRGTHVWRWGDIADWVAAGARDMRRRRPTPEETEEEQRLVAEGTRELMTAMRRAASAGRAAVAGRAAHTGSARKKTA